MSARAHCFISVVVFFCFVSFRYFLVSFGRLRCNSAVPACVPCACVCVRTRMRLCPVCVRVYVIPGEPVAGQCVSPHQGHAGGGDADDRQPLRLGLPPLLLPSAPLQRLQGPPARGTHSTPTLLSTRHHTHAQAAQPPVEARDGVATPHCSPRDGTASLASNA